MSTVTLSPPHTFTPASMLAAETRCLVSAQVGWSEGAAGLAGGCEYQACIGEYQACMGRVRGEAPHEHTLRYIPQRRSVAGSRGWCTRARLSQKTPSYPMSPSSSRALRERRIRRASRAPRSTSPGNVNRAQTSDCKHRSASDDPWTRRNWVRATAFLHTSPREILRGGFRTGGPNRFFGVFNGQNRHNTASPIVKDPHGALRRA